MFFIELMQWLVSSPPLFVPIALLVVSYAVTWAINHSNDSEWYLTAHRIGLDLCLVAAGLLVLAAVNKGSNFRNIVGENDAIGVFFACLVLLAIGYVLAIKWFVSTVNDPLAQQVTKREKNIWYLEVCRLSTYRFWFIVVICKFFVIEQ